MGSGGLGFRGQRGAGRGDGKLMGRAGVFMGEASAGRGDRRQRSGDVRESGACGHGQLNARAS